MAATHLTAGGNWQPNWDDPARIALPSGRLLLHGPQTTTANRYARRAPQGHMKPILDFDSGL